VNEARGDAAVPSDSPSVSSGGNNIVSLLTVALRTAAILSRKPTAGSGGNCTVSLSTA
jgi:hypothetical protein